MPSNHTHPLISRHLAGGAMVAGEEIGLIADQVLGNPREPVLCLGI